MNVILKYWKGILSVIFGFAAFLFWMYPYVGILNFHEEFQMFLFDTDYFVSRISMPGGLANYIAEFIIQFYYIPSCGAFLLAAIYVILQRLLWLISRNDGATGKVYLLTFISPILLWLVMSDVNVMLCYVVSLLIVLLFVFYYTRFIRHARIIYCIIAIPCMYWVIGPAIYVFIAYVIASEIKKASSKLNAIFISIFYIIYIIAVILITSINIQYPLPRLFYGLYYYRFPLMPFIVLAMTGIFAFTPAVLVWLRPYIKFAGRKEHLLISCQILVLIVGTYFLVDYKYNTLDYEVISYDNMVRHQQWDKIISYAEQKNPTTPQSVCCLNLALAQTGQLGDKAFSFYQNGSDGLIPSFKRDFTSPLPASEVCFYLGMINAAQQNVFEAQEAIPNYNKSCRCTKRLAETNLINGQYGVSSKYLRMLQKTLFYNGWATEQLGKIANKQSIDSDPLYGTLRQLSYKKDFLFSRIEKNEMIGKLFTINTNNKMALEYLLTYQLLDCNMNNFLMYFKFMKMAHYDHFPICYQQALVYVWSQSHHDFNGIPNSYDQFMLQRFMDFYQIYSTDGPKSPKLDQYKDTYWHYFLVQK